MNSVFRKAWISLKALRELGFSQTGLYAVYQLRLRSGLLRRSTQAALRSALTVPPGDLAPNLLPEPDLPTLHTLIQPEASVALLRQCEEICSGTARIFAGNAVPILASHPTSLQDWSAIREADLGEDVKFTWEAARFGWSFPLAQAYRLTGDERYPEAFLSLSERFFQANPPYQGVHWASAQEVAMRLMALVFASQLFGLSRALSAARRETLARWIALHAKRIPPSLAYARAQNNNHLLCEAAGLFTAGLALPDHPQASDWQRLGWRWLEQGLLNQITESGAYIQHSANYHRLMLQIALWATILGESHGSRWDEPILRRIQAAIRWLAALLDLAAGKAPNLGPNDSAYLFPLTQCPADDYRPVLQAAYRLFFNQPLLPEGPWDDMSAWLGIQEGTKGPLVELPKNTLHPLTLRHPLHDSWCYLRAAHFTARPGHADQLHLDLWWRGENIALDPGTFRYNAPPPWDNALTHTAVHNTLTLENQEQMTRAGRFLYLDWAQAEATLGEQDQITAWHDGYRRLDLKHQRSVQAMPWGWKVEDQVIPLRKSPPVHAITACLHWLAPDWPWNIERADDQIHLSLESPYGIIGVRMQARLASSPSQMGLRPFVVRAGQTLLGDGADQATWGWIAPVYGLKLPALAFGVQTNGRLPFTLLTEWHL